MTVSPKKVLDVGCLIQKVLDVGCLILRLRGANSLTFMFCEREKEHTQTTQTYT